MPSHRDTRPTSDRVREAALSLIATWAGTGGEPAERMLTGISFLDLYAGSAAVALEAASRGAAPVTAVEHDRATADVARGNVRATGLGVAVVVAKAEKFVAERAPLAYDVVWADPPYALATDLLERLLRDVIRQGWLADRGLLVVERASRDRAVSWPDSVEETWDRRYGETTLYLATKGQT